MQWIASVEQVEALSPRSLWRATSGRTHATTTRRTSSAAPSDPDTWLHVVRGLTGFRGDERAWRAWLFTTAHRRMVDEVRRRSRRPARALEEVPPDQLPVSSDAADLAMEHMSTRSAMALVARLPAHQAEVIMLRVVAGLDTETVARLTRRSPGAVRVAAHRGLRRMAEILAEADVTL